jgi:hypothetical protein
LDIIWDAEAINFKHEELCIKEENKKIEGGGRG